MGGNASGRHRSIQGARERPMDLEADLDVSVMTACCKGVERSATHFRPILRPSSMHSHFG